ncbi:hypothetical protein JDS77_23245 [Bacillus cereus group sp. N28]|nr:hypothetical protein [Bacillus cereus group sp. N28]MBJ7960584.1 hypothetical protein [Bacillus cereus group sp. N28]
MNNKLLKTLICCALFMGLAAYSSNETKSSFFRFGVILNFSLMGMGHAL